jgi:hypothetical protein
MTDWSVIVNVEPGDRLHIGVTGFGGQILDESDTQQGALLFNDLMADKPAKHR